MLSLTTSLSRSSRSYLLLFDLDRVHSSVPPRTIPGARAVDFLGPLGHVGMTAYFVRHPFPTFLLWVLILFGVLRA